MLNVHFLGHMDTSQIPKIATIFILVQFWLILVASYHDGVMGNSAQYNTPSAYYGANQQYTGSSYSGTCWLIFIYLFLPFICMIIDYNYNHHQQSHGHGGTPSVYHHNYDSGYSNQGYSGKQSLEIDRHLLL